MSRKIAWPILLLLLTSVQSFAVACNVRCALRLTSVKAAATDNSMRGMEHCDGMSSAPSQNESAAHSLQALQMRSGTTCCGDLSFAQDPGTAEQTDISLHALDHASFTESITSPAPVQKHKRPPSHSDTVPPANSTTLVSNLRI